jgi:hypothetical protein
VRDRQDQPDPGQRQCEQRRVALEDGVGLGGGDRARMVPASTTSRSAVRLSSARRL